MVYAYQLLGPAVSGPLSTYTVRFSEPDYEFLWIFFSSLKQKSFCLTHLHTRLNHILQRFCLFFSGYADMLDDFWEILEQFNHSILRVYIIYMHIYYTNRPL